MAVNVAAIKKTGADLGIQRSKLPVYEFYAGSGNHTETFPYVMREILFSNDSLTDNVSIQVLGPAPGSLNVTFVLLPNEVIDERLPEFTQIVITAVGAWRFYPRTSVVP